MQEDLKVLNELTGVIGRGGGAALATVTATYKSSPRKAGAKMLVLPDGSTRGTIGGGLLEALVITEARKALEHGAPVRVEYSMDPDNPESIKMCCGGEIQVFIDLFLPLAPMLILGGGHVGEKIARIAEVIGMPYAVADDRREYANRERFPLAAGLFRGPYREAFEKLQIGKETYIVICTRGHEFDLLCLREALKTEAAYIGVIASRKKAERFREQLEKEGSPVDDDRVYSPIGLDLGDSSPGQIALSVMAEVVALKSGGGGRHKRAHNRDGD